MNHFTWRRASPRERRNRMTTAATAAKSTAKNRNEDKASRDSWTVRAMWSLGADPDPDQSRVAAATWVAVLTAPAQARSDHRREGMRPSGKTVGRRTKSSWKAGTRS